MDFYGANLTGIQLEQSLSKWAETLEIHCLTREMYGIALNLYLRRIKLSEGNRRSLPNKYK
jgi:hypothetical protein